MSQSRSFVRITFFGLFFSFEITDWLYWVFIGIYVLIWLWKESVLQKVTSCDQFVFMDWSATAGFFLLDWNYFQRMTHIPTLFITTRSNRIGLQSSRFSSKKQLSCPNTGSPEISFCEKVNFLYKKKNMLFRYSHFHFLLKEKPSRSRSIQKKSLKKMHTNFQRFETMRQSNWVCLSDLSTLMTYLLDE